MSDSDPFQNQLKRRLEDLSKFSETQKEDELTAASASPKKIFELNIEEIKPVEFSDSNNSPDHSSSSSAVFSSKRLKNKDAIPPELVARPFLSSSSSSSSSSISAHRRKRGRPKKVHIPSPFHGRGVGSILRLQEEEEEEEAAQPRPEEKIFVPPMAVVPQNQHLAIQMAEIKKMAPCNLDLDYTRLRSMDEQKNEPDMDLRFCFLCWNETRAGGNNMMVERLTRAMDKFAECSSVVNFCSQIQKFYNTTIYPTIEKSDFSAKWSLSQIYNHAVKHMKSVENQKAYFATLMRNFLDITAQTSVIQINPENPNENTINLKNMDFVMKSMDRIIDLCNPQKSQSNSRNRRK